MGSSMTNSYGVTSPLPRVCVNPEILKILGYSNQSKIIIPREKNKLFNFFLNSDCSDYYYSNNNRLTNGYGLQVVIDPQTGVPQTVMGRTSEMSHQPISKTSIFFQSLY
jgi:hypothetical protein